MNIITNIGDLNEKSVELDENLVFSDVLSLVNEMLKRADVNTVTITSDKLEHLTFQCRQYAKKNSAFDIYGVFKPLFIPGE